MRPSLKKTLDKELSPWKTFKTKYQDDGTVVYQITPDDPLDESETVVSGNERTDELLCLVYFFDDGGVKMYDYRSNENGEYSQKNIW